MCHIMRSLIYKKTLLELGWRIHIFMANSAWLGSTCSRNKSAHNSTIRHLLVLPSVALLLMMPINAVANIVVCYAAGGQEHWARVVTKKACKDFDFGGSVTGCIDNVLMARQPSPEAILKKFHPILDGSTILNERDGIFILSTQNETLVAARKYNGAVEVADLPSPESLFGIGDVFIGAVTRERLIPLPPIQGLSYSGDNEVAQSDIAIHFTVLDSKNSKIILSRQILPVVLSSLIFHPLSPKASEAPKVVSAGWLVEVEEGKTARATLTINNRCSAPHLFSIKSKAKGLRFEQQTDKVLIGASASKILGASFDAKGLKSKVYRGKVVIKCLDCKTEPKCTQDRDELSVEMTVFKPRPAPSQNVNLPKMPSQ